ncbi:g4885 [Coccomyxa viridis]|uniref:cysteine--tRNA ligase n=1 Tax=Coccomyxa viridis TaxID=1274662 RepID=A0ABP1FRF9_9CHLO
MRPRNEGDNKLSMYCCGVTVYDLSHIGHARVYCCFDVLYRLLRHLGYEVQYVRNFTDIDDKIIARAAEIGEDPLQLSQRFITEFHRDMLTLNCLTPTIEPKATDYIPEMVSMIEQLVNTDHAYEADGSVWFAVETFENYGRLSGRTLEDNRAGERVAVNTSKRHPADFVLWKAAKPNEPTWESPWGPGRPGWHIECSAMIRKLMGPVIDIHGGGRDLIHPHHDNEIAQSQAACCSHGEERSEEFVRLWMHLGFVNVDSEKMSKSLGNFFTIREILQKYNSLALRWFLTNSQYRQPLNFSHMSLEEASDRVYYVHQTLVDAEAALGSSETSNGAPEQDCSELEGIINSVQAALCDDLNTPQAIALLSEPLKMLNDLLHTKKGRKVEGRLTSIKALHSAIKAALQFMGLDAQDSGTLLSDLRTAALSRAGLTEEDILQSIERRAAARAEKDYSASDHERASLAERGILLMDGPQGSTWRPGVPQPAREAALPVA